MRNVSADPALSIESFQKVQRDVIYFPNVVRKKLRIRHILFKNGSIQGENREIYGP